jgi:hypothetical protein
MSNARSLALLAILVISGCATAPVSPASATRVPAERLFAFQDPAPERSATLIVTRDSGFLGSGCFYSFTVNGIHAARFGAGETAKFHVPPGEILLRNGRDQMGRGLCAVEKDLWTQRETVVRAGETKYFRLSLDASGQPDVQRSDSQ